ncbi:MAG: deoxyribose-phosphate aldolase [Thermoproteus sp. AZ2]|jgi:deoxyribose-phosphate aldolase|uniref:Deoxyribose-phosphate aldolase n=1 Tax=Thermoproteus sp. AZ2 TaxID=1609232 RepID=A0ACC6V2P5_9CREN|nr:MAG: deoxyribose-phosphate aldolase [Thermoproteus sp. AZ2]
MFTKESLARLIDHTILNPAATPRDVEKYCREVLEYGFWGVVVNPVYVSYAKSIIGNRARVMAVVGFPFGSHKTSVKLAEAEAAIEDGADELDMVMNIGAFKAGLYELVERDIKAVASLAHDYGAILKAIIETGYLTPEEIVKASQLAARAGADFVKTSTGYGPRGATVEDVQLIYKAVEGRVGVKAAGGIRTAQQAIAMIKAGATRIGSSHGVDIINTLA